MLGMTVSYWILCLTGVWCVVCLLDIYFKNYSIKNWRDTYHKICSEKGLSVQSLRIQWYTKVFNSVFQRLSRIKPHFLDLWFSLGVYVSIICCFLSIALLTIVPLNTLFRSQKAEDQILKPVIPGVNLPQSDIGYYMITLFLSAVIHELGHAVAAARDNVKINGFGIFVLALYPGAFVDMHSESLFATDAWKQLKIFCGGVWHNLVISAAGLLTLLCLPSLISPLYSVHEHLVAVSHTPESVVSGPAGLYPGDIITHIDDCPTARIADWIGCLTTSLQSNASISYRVPAHLTESLKPPVRLTDEDCECDQSEKHICYEVLSPTADASKPVLRCLKARDVIGYERCSKAEREGCIAPYLKCLGDDARLLVITRKSGPPVLFLGHPSHLHQSLILGEVLPKSSFAPFNLPYIVENLCKYFVSLSGALAILNVVPCYALDGQYIAKAAVDLLMPRVHPEKRELIFTLLVLFGTGLLLVNVILAMFMLFFG